MAFQYWPVAIGPAGPAGPPGSAGPPGPPGPPGPGGGGGCFIGSFFGQNYNGGQTTWVSITNSGFGSATSSNPDDENVTPIPIDCTLQGFFITCSDVGGSAPQPGTGSLQVTVTLNGVDTALVLTVPPGSTSGIYSNTVDSVVANAGDYFGLKIHNNAATASINIADLVLAFS